MRKEEGKGGRKGNRGEVLSGAGGGEDSGCNKMYIRTPAETAEGL